MKKYIWILVIGSPMLAIGMVLIQVYYNIAIWTYDGDKVIFDIKPGETFSKINGRLYHQNIISSSKLFYQYSKRQGLMTKFKAGRYNIEPGTTMLEIIDILTIGRSITTKITIPEGKNLFEMAKILEAKNICNANDFIKLAKSKEFTTKLGIPADRLEGYLYPDTYNFPENTGPKTVIKTMFNNLQKRIKKLDFSNPPNGLSLHQVIILASIVEKETGAKSERAIIAGVYHNRLKKRMRLYSDPTTIYGIWETYNGNLRKKHLQQKTEYNTYRMNGLPKGPITNPGIAAIEATLKPEKHNYTYFVSKNNGTHEFTTNYKDHLKAVDFWQKTRKNRKGKSWRDLKKSEQ